MKNYAFIDTQNLYLAIRSQGWKLDYKKLRTYLKDKYEVEVAYLFIGYLPENSKIYSQLQKDGFVLIFKETIKHGLNTIKGNCDAELVLQAMIDYEEYDKAVIISGDGDFSCLVRYLYDKDKLQVVLVPNQNRYSVLIKKTAKEKIDFISILRPKLEFTNSKKP